jgi:zinc protease
MCACHRITASVILPSIMPRFFVATLAVLLGLAVQSSRAAEAEDESTPVTEKLVQGSLPNGLRYVILPHGSPRGGISLRLIVQAGSLDERDDERGFAHFVEHTAFKGTRTFPAGTVRLFFETLGVQFGPDLNANTGFTHTQYLLDLPAGRADRLSEALILLRDYADGQLFLPDEVKREAKVVLAEMHARDTGGKRTAVERQKILYAGTKIVEREVIGLQEQIEGATADQLRAFYRRNYCPNRMVLLIVGRVDPEKLPGLIAENFDSMQAAAEGTAPYAEAETPRSPGVKAAALVIPTLTTGAGAEFNFVSEHPADTVEGRRQEQLQHLGINVLDRRLEAKRERDVLKYPGRPMISTAPSALSSRQTLRTIALGGAFGDWPDALEFIESELRRGREGFTQAEIDEAVTVAVNAVQNRSPTAARQTVSSLVGEISARLLAGREWQAPAVRNAEIKAALAGVTPADVAVEFSRIFPADSCQLILIIPPDRAVSPERILAAYEKSAGRVLKAAKKPAEELHFRYEDFGPAGKIAKQDRVEDLNLSLVTFENGVRLNVRPTKFESEQFRLRIVFPQNLSDVPDNFPGISDLAGYLLLNSGLRKHKQTEMVRLLQLHGIKSGFSVSTGTPALTLSGPVAELGFALRYLTALLSDLEFDDDYYSVALSHYAGLFKNVQNSAGGVGMREALRVFAGDDQRALLLNPKGFANTDGLMMTGKWLRNYVLAGPLEVGLVGGFSADEAITAAADTLGTLKARKAAPKPGAPLALPKKTTRSEAMADLQSGTSFSCVLWPVTTPDDPKKNAALTLATEALRDQLLAVVREAVGATYSPETHIHRDSIQRDFAFVGMINTFDPESARKYTEACVKLAARLAERGLSAAEFERIREPARARYAKDVRNTGWWLNEVVAQAQSRPAVLDQARQHGKIMEEITLEEVNQAAQVFKSDKITIMIVRPKSAGAPGGNPAKKK